MGAIRSILGCAVAANIAAAPPLASAAGAQTVRIDAGDQSGHGLMLRHRNTCYVVTAAHVVEGQLMASVRTAAPVLGATALMQTPFWPGMDMAVGVLRGEDILPRCTVTLGQLAGAELRGDLMRAPALVRLRDSGEVERMPLRLRETGYLEFTAAPLNPEDSLWRGSSGAFAMDGAAPLGMVVRTDAEGRTGHFIRIEEIGANLQRWITRGVGLQAVGAAPGARAAAGAAPLEGLPAQLVSALRPAIGSEHLPENLLGPGAYVFEPGRNRIVFRLSGPAAVPVSGMRLQSQPAEGQAMPMEVRVELSSAAEGERWRLFFEGEVAPDGLLEFHRSAQLARRVSVTVLSARSAGPVRIDSISFE